MAGTGLTRRMLIGGAAAVPFAGRAGAQTAWPDRPVRVMVPYPPAGGADTTARIVYAGWARISASNSPSKIAAAPAARSARKSSPKPRPTATRFCTTPRRSRSTARSIRIAVRLPQGFRSGRPGRAGAEYSRRHAVGAGEYGRRRHRAMPKRRPTASIWRRPATARCSISLLELFARIGPASRSITCRIAAAAWRSPTSWRAR